MRAGVKVGDRVEVTVEKAVYRGLGLARHEGQIVFVPRTFPGDRARVRIATVGRGYARGAVEGFLERCVDRREPPCALAGLCGGCAYQELAYPTQLAIKEAVLRESLDRAGVSWPAPVPPSPSPERGWRSRASFHFETRGQTLRLGLHQEGGHEVVDLPRCLQISDAMNGLTRALHGELSQRPGLWDRLSGLVVAEGSESGLVAMVEARVRPREALQLTSLREAAPALTGLCVLAASEGRESLVVLHGQAHVRTRVLGLSLVSHVQSFFQANRFLVETLAEHVLSLVPDEGPVLDLYAGVGLLALPMAARGQDVRGLEISAEAVRDAGENARRAGLTRVRIEEGEVGAALRALSSRPGEHVVLDPPRTGAGRAIVEAIVDRRPETVVYVSCDPPTLGRDLAFFAQAGFALESLSAFDMFPDTFHLETVARLHPIAAGKTCDRHRTVLRPPP
jgi:23S rRNA (uracil1939-C5)-methyltransferase